MADSTRVRRRADLAKSDVSIARLLSDLGYHVRPDGGEREQQFSCDLHGDGHDSKPSARIYPDNTWYCFACDKMRDTIETVREVKDFGFMDAIKWLEERYDLKPVAWEAGDSGDYAPREKTQREQVSEHLDSTKTFEDDAHVLESWLDAITKDRDLPMEQTAAFWEAYDKLVYMVDKKLVPEPRARAAIWGIRTRIMKVLRGGP